MRLGDILRNAGTARLVDPHPVTFGVVGEDEHMRPITGRATGVLYFVNEHERAAIRVDAQSDLSARFPGKELNTSVIKDEITYRTLFLALRDSEANDKGFHKQFAENLPSLRVGLVREEAGRLIDEYEAWVAREFPPAISDEVWKKLVEDAKKNSLSDLLTEYGYENVARVLSFSAGRSSR